MSAPRRKNKHQANPASAPAKLAGVQCAAIVDAMSDALIVTDEMGHIQFCNPAAATLFGYCAGELVGKNVCVLLAGPYRSDPDSLRHHSGDGDGDGDGESESESEGFRKGEFTRRADGAEIRIERRVNRLIIDGKQHAVHVIRETTSRRKPCHNDNEFLAAAAHELRSPMASIYGFSELLLQRRFAEARQKELLEIVYNQAAHVTRLINELLDLARIEARGERAFNMQRQSVEPIMRATVAGFLIPPGRSAVYVIVEPDLPQVNADADKLQQALTNILSNAYKYSPEGGPVELRARTDASRERVLVTVADRGVGMTEDVSSRIFERFYRADDTETIRGTGLGMTLVKEIVEHHGGNVEIESRAGKGTRATLILPAIPGA
jgi:PAS domain S-box-containing protein